MKEPTKKRGRPTIGYDPASDTLPAIRVTAEQKRRYRIASTKSKKSLSSWIKDLADKASDWVPPQD